MEKKTEKKKKDETDYHALYAMGIIFMGVGIALSAAVSFAFMGIFALGLIFFMSGATNKNKWKVKKQSHAQR